MTNRPDITETPENHQPGFMLAQELLIRKLMSPELQCGQQLKESVLAKEFGINRPSVREALSQAVGWGVVEYVPYCGYRIRNFTLNDLRAWGELREAIEPLAARRLAGCLTGASREELERLLQLYEDAIAAGDHALAGTNDFRFHLAIVRLCGNERFASPSNLCYFSVLARLNYNFWTRLYYLVRGGERKYQSHNDNFEEFYAYNDCLTLDAHRQILTELIAGNATTAESLVRDHVSEQSANIGKVINFLGDADIALEVFQKNHSIDVFRKHTGNMQFNFDLNTPPPGKRTAKPAGSTVPTAEAVTP